VQVGVAAAAIGSVVTVMVTAGGVTVTVTVTAGTMGVGGVTAITPYKIILSVIYGSD
jgi:hypothetical protein